jgi:hypothetical protein
MKNLEKRYISIKLAGKEIYTENLRTQGKIEDIFWTLETRFNGLKQAMPNAECKMTVEEEYKQERFIYIKSLDIETGKCSARVCKKIKNETKMA